MRTGYTVRMRAVVLSLALVVCLPVGARAASYAGKPTRQGGFTLSAAVRGPDVALGGTVTTMKTGAIGLAVAPSGRPAQRYRFAGWNRVRWHERRKAGWRIVARAMAAAAR
jgi:hypothetical protein